MLHVIILTRVDFNEDKRKVPQYLVSGAKALAAALKSWTHKKDVSCQLNSADNI